MKNKQKLLYRSGSFVLAFLLCFQLTSVIVLANSKKNQAKTSADMSSYLKSVSATVTQNGAEITDSQKIDSSKEVDVKFSFRVPVIGDGNETNVVKQGDTAKIALSKGFSLLSPSGTFELKNGSTKVGTVSISSDSVAKDLTANIVFDGESSVFDGTDDGSGIWSNVVCSFSCKLKYDSSGNDGTSGDHTVTIINKEYTVTVPPAALIISGETSGIVNGQYIDWTVKVNALKGSAAGDLSGCVFSDNLINIGTFVTGSFKTGTKSDGSDASAVSPTVSGATISYTFPSNTSGTRYLFFRTKIYSSVYYNNSETILTNNATITDTNNNVSTLSTTVPVKITWIKQEEADKDNLTGKITWNITVNQPEASLSNVKITDVLDKKLDWMSAKLMIWDSNTSSWTESSAVTFTSQPSDGLYSIGNISTKAMLVLSAQLKPIYECKHTAYTVTNTATLTYGSSNTRIGSDSAVFSIGVNPVTNAVGTGGYNSSTHKVPWNLSVSKSDINDNLRVMDLLVYGASGFDANSKTYTINGNGSGLAHVSAGDLKLLTPQYNQKYAEKSYASNYSDCLDFNKYTVMEGSTPVADLIVVTGKNNTGIDVSSENIPFTFSSLVTNPNIYFSNNSTEISNTASLFSSGEFVNSATVKAKCNSRVLKKDVLSIKDAQKDLTVPENVNVSAGTASDCYNYNDNSCIFRIHVNASGVVDGVGGATVVYGKTLGDVTVSDVLPDGWEFKNITSDKNFLIFEGDSNFDNVTATSLLTDPDFVTADFSNTGKVNFTFTSLGKPYLILLKAGPTKDTAANYFSVNQSISANTSVKLTAVNWYGYAGSNVQTIINSEILKKTAPENVTNGSVRWTIEYKPNQLPHYGMCLADTLPDGIELPLRADGSPDLSSGNVTITKLSLNEDGTYADDGDITPENGQNIIYDNSARRIKFVLPDTRQAYRFTYLTYVTTDSDKEVENTVCLSSDTENTVNSTAAIKVTSYDASVAMTYSGWIQITKQSLDGTALANAEFTVYALDGAAVIRKGVTSSDGNLIIRGLPAGTFILKETKAPDGYNIDNKSHYVVVSDDGGSIVTSIDKKSGPDSNKITVTDVPTGIFGSLSITNTLSGNAVDKDKDFIFTVNVEGANGTYSFVGSGGKEDGYIVFDDGIGKISLKGGQSVTIENLPRDAFYTVVEKDYSLEGYSLTSTGSSGTIIADEIESAAFINTKNSSETKNIINTGGLLITKNVSGKGADKAKAFRFKIIFSDSAKTYSYVGIGTNSGTLKSGDTIMLSHGQGILITNLPEKTKYTVTEDDYTSSGYRCDAVSKSGVISGNVIYNAKYINVKDSSLNNKIANPDSGDNTDLFWQTALIISCVLSCALIIFLNRIKA